MCGINGIISLNSDSNLILRLREMNKLIKHRGPDDCGEFLYKDQVAMGMQRLSIIDLTNGNQPMFSKDKSKVIVFNGEIYNYLDLKKELQLAGEVFLTNSDTEVILKLFEKYGNSSFCMLNGMFVFSIYDLNTGIVTIARDRFGEKPLYYTKKGYEFIWASELKSIVSANPNLKNISENALRLFFSLSYIPAPYTIYKDVHKLQPGYFMTINSQTAEYSIERYWNIEVPEKLWKGSYGKACNELRTLLFSSVKSRMIADVPLGVFLSGGTDSAIIAAVMKEISDSQIKTFTVGFKNKRYDESKKASDFAKHIGSDHSEFLLDFNEIVNDLNDLIINYDEPYADSSAIPTYFISKRTADCVKVVLTGDGGDEVFGGYNKYLIHTYGQIYNNFVPALFTKNIVNPLIMFFSEKNVDTKSIATKAKKFLESIGKDTTENHLSVIQLAFRNEQLNQLLQNKSVVTVTHLLLQIIDELPVGMHRKLDIARYIDTKISLEGDLLVKIDRASMLASLECRSPFLDPSLMKFSYSIPESYLVLGKNRKRILKDSFKGLMPKNFLSKSKSGFEVPIAHWFRNELKEDLIYMLSDKNLQMHGLLNKDFVQHLMSEHFSSKFDHSSKLWSIYCFQKWYIHSFN
jgi:asparagine synthase (glutamine-hydrolysing)